MKSITTVVLLATAAGGLGLMAPLAEATMVATTVTNAGTYSYNYSPWDGVSVNGGTASGTSLSIPSSANPSSDLYVQTGLIASGTYGVSNYTTNPGTMTWDFQTASGLAFGSGFSFSAGGLNNESNSSNSTMTGAYSTDNGSTYTTFYNNSNQSIGLDSTQVVSGVNLTGATQLLVQFAIQNASSNQIAFFWGSTDPMTRAFMLSGNVVATPTPEPAPLVLFAAGAVGLLLIARKRKIAR